MTFGRGDTLSRGNIDVTTNLAGHLGARQTPRTLLGVPWDTKHAQQRGSTTQYRHLWLEGHPVGVRPMQSGLEVTPSTDLIEGFIGRTFTVTRYLYLMHCRAADKSTLCFHGNV